VSLCSIFFFDPLEDNTNYLLNMGKNLTNLEKIVVLLIDEIYVSSRLDYPDNSYLLYKCFR
jgi:hypothetical protein